MKIAGYMITKNGLTGFIDTAINSLYDTTDVLYVSDNGSTDGTKEWLEQNPKVDKVIEDDHKYNENAHLIRQKVINEVLKENPDWLIGLDDDEQIVDPMGIRQVLKSKDEFNALSFSFLHLWDDKHYRYDGSWKPGNVPRIIGERVEGANDIEIQGEGNHCPRIPLVNDEIKLISDVFLIHYGWRYKDDELRKKKMDKKAERDEDPQDIQVEHYQSVHEEPELQELPYALQGMIVDGYKDEQRNDLLRG